MSNKIELSKEYVTESGRAVEIYRTTNTLRGLTIGAVATTGNLWEAAVWTNEGKCQAPSMCLKEKPLFSELDICWDSLRSNVRFIAMDIDGVWSGFDDDPVAFEGRWVPQDVYGLVYGLSAVVMPQVDSKHWLDTLTKRPS